MSADYPVASEAERANRVIRISEVPEVQLVPGTSTHIVPGRNMTLSFITLGANQSFPVHSHEHEEMIIVLKGELDTIFEDKRYRMGEGDVMPVEAGVPHGVQILDNECVLLEIFAPARKEYEEKLRQASGSA